MKMIASVLFCGLVACGGGNKAATKPTGGEANAGEGTPCTQEIALVCPDGQIDACLKAAPEEDQAAADDGADESGGTGTAMALDEGKMGKAENAGTHRCVDK